MASTVHFGAFLRFWLMIIMGLMAFALATPAAAQTTYSNTDTTANTIDENTTPCTTPLIRTFNVTGSGVVSDINIGVLLSHTYRGDLRLTLKSPSGAVSVALMTNAGGGRDNLNVLFDDSAGSGIGSHNSSSDNTGTTPWERTFRPTSLLSAFNGVAPAGTWTLEICDSANGDAGAFLRADLIVSTITSYADLSVTKSVSNASPSSGSTIIYTLRVTNSSAATLGATGVSISDVLPAGLSYVSASGHGTYNSGTGAWTVGTVPIGVQREIQLTVVVTASGTTITNVAQVSAQNEADLDSAPNNSVTTEDDYASVAITVSARAAGTPPTLTCPVGSTLFDWDSVTWTAGSTSNSYTVANIGTLVFGITAPSGAFQNNATFGGAQPALAGSSTGANTGGFSGTQLSLHQLVDFASQTDTSVTTITLPGGVPGLQFRIFDVDFGAGDFSDKVTVTGTLNSAPVTPTLTNGVANYVVGNVAIGDAGSAATSANGNVVVTFTTPVDTIVITYGNHTTAPSAPGDQAIAIHDMTFCNPLAVLSMTKVSALYNNGVSPQFYIPENEVTYTIAIANSGLGSTTVDTIFLVDPLPANLKFFFGDVNGAAAGTDAIIFTDSGSGLTFTYANDVRFSTTAPANFAACGITPASLTAPSYPVSVRFICINPKGVLNGKTGPTSPGFSISFRAKID